MLTFSNPRSRKRRKPAPVFRFGEERLNPDLPLAHRFGVRLCCVMVADSVEHLLVETAPNPSASP